jgi:hypothetical protein
MTVSGPSHVSSDDTVTPRVVEHAVSFQLPEHVESDSGGVDLVDKVSGDLNFHAQLFG